MQVDVLPMGSHEYAVNLTEGHDTTAHRVVVPEEMSNGACSGVVAPVGVAIASSWPSSSSALCGRSAGCLARHRMINAASAGGTVARSGATCVASGHGPCSAKWLRYVSTGMRTGERAMRWHGRAGQGVSHGRAPAPDALSRSFVMNRRPLKV